MELTKAFMELRPAGLAPLYQLFALVCLVTIIYKVTAFLAQRSDMMRHFKAFPGPPGHWFFGHSLKVDAEEFARRHICKIVQRQLATVQAEATLRISKSPPVF